jgi:hypothetical protein
MQQPPAPLLAPFNDGPETVIQPVNGDCTFDHQLQHLMHEVKQLFVWTHRFLLFKQRLPEFNTFIQIVNIFYQINLF